MIGWSPRPFLFVHIPKCAGTSIEKALIPIATPHKDFRDLSEEERCRHWLPGGKGLQHCKLKGFERYFPTGDFLKFAIVRNPWDRAVSQIQFLRSKTGHSLFSGTDFKADIRTYCDTRRNVWAHDLSATQSDYLRRKSGELGMDFVGKFENLDADFANVCNLLGLAVPLTLPHIFNSGRSRHYSSFFDDESAEWVRMRFLPDVEAFGYKFERA